jgi:hypothetical protein
MSTGEGLSAASERNPPVVKMNLEVQVIPASDVDRAQAFLRAAGLEARRRHIAPLDRLRIIRFTLGGV